MERLGIMPDWRIEELCKEHKMISPFTAINQKNVVSYGLSSMGYDVRLSNDVRVFVNALDMPHKRIKIIDPKNFYPKMTDEVEVEKDGSVILPPHSFSLGSTIEYIKMPDNVIGLALGKSTYARCGLIVSITPLEPGWHGNVTIEMTNATPVPIKIYPTEGICQFIFFEGSRPRTTYKTRQGKYQNQEGVTYPKVLKD